MPTILVCGGRYFANRQFLFQTLDQILADRGWSPEDVRLITGDARGADTLALNWAKERRCPCKVYFAHWHDLTHPDRLIRRRKDGTKYDARAGHRRNQTMLDEEAPVLCVAFPGNKGTADMIKRAKITGIEVLTPAPQSQSRNKTEENTCFMKMILD